MKRSIICVILALMFLLPLMHTAVVASGNTSIEALEDKLASATAKRQAAERTVKGAESDLADALVKKEAIDAKIYALNTEIDVLLALIDGYNVMILEKNTEIDASRKQLDTQYSVLRQRVRAKREEGIVGILSILLESNGLSRFFAGIDRFTAMLDYDTALMASYKRGIEELEFKKSELTAAKAELDTGMKELEARKKELESDLVAASRLVATETNKLSGAKRDLEKVAAVELEYSNKRAELLNNHQQATNQSYVGGEFLWPLPSNYKRVSSKFGWRIHPVTGKDQFHQGIDIPAPYGTNIYAINSGTVVECSYNYADGYYITVSHGGGIASFYSHLSQYRVSVGDKVKKGQVIANVGTSGYTTGAHLNINLYKDGTAVNPLDYIG